MADDDETTTEGNEGGKETPKQLRNKLETTLSENAELKGKLLIYDAGLGHLTEKQRKAVVRDASESGGEVTADMLKASAKELGFPETLKTETETPKPGEGGEQNGQGNERNDGGEGNDADTVDALTSMDAIEQAQRRTVTTAADGSFADKMSKATTQADVEALIRSEGHKVGIVHEWDVE